MFSQHHERRHLDDHAAKAMAEAAQPALRWVNTDEKAPGEQSGPSCGAEFSPGSASGAEPDQASKFTKGLSIALPMSICLWAFMLWAIRAIW
jgi:hypothetical protein